MPAKTFKCPSCGAGLVFSPENGGFACEFCGSSYSEEELMRLSEEAELAAEAAMKKEQAASKTAFGNTAVKDTAAKDTAVSPEKEKSFGVKKAGISSDSTAGNPSAVYEYHCQSCGATVTVTDTTAATICYYCGNPVVISDRVSGEREPDFVIPFSIDKSKALDGFITWVKSKKFVPNNFFERSGCNLTGVYYPHWHADIDFDASFSGEGVIVNTVSTPKDDIITSRHYRVERSGKVELNNIMRPALKDMDRVLSDGVEPYDMNGAKEFQMGYLSGFSAEKRNVDSAEIEPDVLNEANSYIENLLTRDSHYTELHGDVSAVAQKKEYKYSLLPTWIISYKGKNGELYHYALNGQTGKACGRLPIDKSRLMRFCGIIGGAVSAALLIGGWLIW